jgi:hypothetical protein
LELKFLPHYILGHLLSIFYKFLIEKCELKTKFFVQNIIILNIGKPSNSPPPTSGEWVGQRYFRISLILFNSEVVHKKRYLIVVNFEPSKHRLGFIVEAFLLSSQNS